MTPVQQHYKGHGHGYNGAPRCRGTTRLRGPMVPLWNAPILSLVACGSRRRKKIGKARMARLTWLAERSSSGGPLGPAPRLRGKRRFNWECCRCGVVVRFGRRKGASREDRRPKRHLRHRGKSAARAIFVVLVLRLQPEKLSETTRRELRVFDAEK
jgi:hypothetical protein